MVASGARAVARCDELGVAPYSDAPVGLFRAWLNPAFYAAQEAIGGWMRAAGMATRVDAATNLIGRYEGIVPDAPALIIGSHIDSVRDAGRYDGPLGVMLGIEAVAALHATGRRLPFAIEVYAFGDEEGSRFPAPMLTSAAVAGTFAPASLAATDADGIAIADALGPRAAHFAAARRSPEEVIGYLEVHIEQGPVLEARGLPVGVVTGIAAQLRFAVVVSGSAGHAGTTAMDLRRDALAGAAEMVLAVERIAAEAGVVGTVGRIEAAPGAPNVIPGRVAFTLDVRAGTDADRDAAAAIMEAEFERIAARRGLAVAADKVHDLSASPCDARLVDMLAAAMQDRGLTPHRLVSGAGHDAMVMAALCSTAMLFVRCAGGVSHNPAEAVDPADADVALAVTLGFLDRLEQDFDA